MIVRWPGQIEAGAVNDLVWYFADVLPTLADLTGVASPEGIDGVSVLPTLLGREQDLSRRFLYWEFFERGFQQAVRWQDWKAVRLEPTEELELYDVSSDQSETRNIAKSHPDVVATIETYLKTARIESDAFPSPLDN